MVHINVHIIYYFLACRRYNVKTKPISSIRSDSKYNVYIYTYSLIVNMITNIIRFRVVVVHFICIQFTYTYIQVIWQVYTRAHLIPSATSVRY